LNVKRLCVPFLGFALTRGGWLLMVWMVVADGSQGKHNRAKDNKEEASNLTLTQRQM